MSHYWCKSYGDDRFSDMIGKTIEAIARDTDGAHVVFRFADGLVARFGVDGDCCSKSWVEHLELPENVIGAELVSVDEANMNTGELEQDHPEHDEENGGGSILVYNTKFHTNRGTIVLEYRNSSNGYYGGSLCRLNDRERVDSDNE